MISDIKRTSHHAVIITNYAIWHQSLKSIHYRILLIFQTKKTTDLRVKTWGGGDKRHVIPPMSKHGGDTYPPSPRNLRPWRLHMSNYIHTYCVKQCTVYNLHSHLKYIMIEQE